MAGDDQVATQRRVLAGWGRTAPTGADVALPVDDAGVRAAAAADAPRGVLARGLGRSYGDAAQNAGGLVADLTQYDGVRSFDPATGIVEAASGLSLEALLRAVVPHGWFPHVTPGTRQVTLGGALASDIHGKNHHVDGSWAAGVRSFDLVTGEGEVVTCRPGDDAFDATAGGMGLTGIATTQALQLQPIPTSRVLVDTERCADLDDLMARMDEGDHRYRFSVAWIDLLASGASLGRSVLTRGDWAPVDALVDVERRTPHAYDPSVLASAPPGLPSGLLNRVTVAAFNELWFRKAPRHRTGEVQTIGAFFHPLDGVADWNRIYGRRGFLQYQFVVPFGADGEAVLRRVVEDLAASGRPSFLAVLKRFGEGGSGHLSFPAPGWTLALDLPMDGSPELAAMLRAFDHRVAGAGGRVYLAKDSCLDPAVLPTMYPRLEEWREVAARLDPGHRFTSDLDRRLGLRA